jgi:hypothetical protein
VAGGGGESLHTFSTADSYEGDIDNLTSETTYVNQAGGTKVDETVNWSRVRYTGYNLLVADATPGSGPGAPSTLLVRGLNENGTEVDRFTLVR